LYYELGNYASKEKIEFNLEKIDQNIDDFDLIFGEYSDLNKLSLNKIKYPKKVQNFYDLNTIYVKDNLLPLDLDTFIIVSKDKIKINNFEDLSLYFDPVKYTLGMSFKSSNNLAEIIDYNNDNKNLDISSYEYERILGLFKKTYKNINKNILSNSYLEIKESYENNENTFTLFSDGVLLNKDFNFNSYQLFPQSKYQWKNKLGSYEERLNHTPYSYYGFSVYINNSNQMGFICHLVNREVRENTFENFDISISPLSEKEIENSSDIDQSYLEILVSKKENIKIIDYDSFDKKYDLIKNIIFSNKSYENLIETNNYLNN
tara:strand:- start:291 stop:1244 length:954 start_codon:yes stop_codon:yes gene_type:complete